MVVGTVLFSAGHQAIAAPVYKYTDKNGRTYYSSAPRSPEDKPAELPDITRGDFAAKVTPKGESCESHGGISCQAGPDKDGSVICADGFIGSPARFRFNCSAAKLEISDVSEVDTDGNAKVFLRNNSSVAASNVAVFRRQDGKDSVKIDGPKEIEPYGIAEFAATGVIPKPGSPPLSAADFEVKCTNCP